MSPAVNAPACNLSTVSLFWCRLLSFSQPMWHFPLFSRFQNSAQSFISVVLPSSLISLLFLSITSLVSMIHPSSLFTLLWIEGEGYRLLWLTSFNPVIIMPSSSNQRDVLPKVWSGRFLYGRSICDFLSPSIDLAFKQHPLDVKAGRKFYVC